MGQITSSFIEATSLPQTKRCQYNKISTYMLVTKKYTQGCSFALPLPEVLLWVHTYLPEQLFLIPAFTLNILSAATTGLLRASKAKPSLYKFLHARNRIIATIFRTTWKGFYRFVNKRHPWLCQWTFVIYVFVYYCMRFYYLFLINLFEFLKYSFGFVVCGLFVGILSLSAWSIRMNTGFITRRTQVRFGTR